MTEQPPRSGHRQQRASLRHDRLLQTAVLVVVAAVGFRTWVVAHSWFRLDDFYFLERSLGVSPTPSFLLHDHAGHLMPAGFLLAWVNAAIDPLAFWLPATEIIALYALACAGFLRLLLTLFGRRRGILVPLVLFCFSPLLLPATTWFAAGVNQLPVLVAIVWALDAHVHYLRTNRQAWAVRAAVWIGAGLLFSERTLLAYEFLGLVALLYFVEGPLPARLRSLWTTYRPGVELHLSMAGIYAVVYLARTGADVVRSHGSDQLLATLGTVVGRAFPPAAVGGPLRWNSVNVFEGLADPSDLVRYGAWALVLFVAAAALTTRHHSKRAWILVATVLFTSSLLLANTRAAVVGADIGLEYRYLTEAGLAWALAVGLAFLPVRDAPVQVTTRSRHWFADDPRKVTAAALLFVALSGWTTLGYMAPDLAKKSSKEYFAHLETSLARQPGPVQLVDLPVPERVTSPFGAPSNFYSHMFRSLDRISVPRVLTSDPYLVDDGGHLRKSLIKAARLNEPGPEEDCGYRAGGGPVTVPLDGPVIGFGWYVRVGYISTGDSPLTLQAGNDVVHTRVTAGLNAVIFSASGPFNSVTISGLSGQVQLCTNDVTVGTPIEAP